MLNSLRWSSVRPAGLLLALSLAACAGGGAPSGQPTSTGNPPTPSATVSATETAGASASTGGDFSALCRDLQNLTDLDYAFGKPFSIVQSLAADSKALTLQHLIGFAASAPPELASAAGDLVGLWTDLVNDPQSVSESDPRWASATDSINTWRDANC